MNQYTGELRALIIEASKRPHGLATESVPGYTIPQVGRMVQKLQSAGVLFRAKVGGKYGRYFDTAERAAEYAKVAAPRPKGKPARGPAEASNPNGVKPVQLSSTLRGRFAVDDVPPLFSSLRPGQYIAPAPAWLESVA